MNKYKLSIARTAIAAVGLACLIFILMILRPVFIPTDWRGTFISVSVVLIYMVLVFPLTFSYTDREETAGIFVGLGVYYKGAGAYAVISAALIGIVYVNLLPKKLAVAGAILAALLFVVYSYLAVFTKAHISSVKAEEKSKAYSTDVLKSAVDALALRAGSLGPEVSDVKESILKLKDNIRYLSPSDKEFAQKKEEKMLEIIDFLLSSQIMQNRNVQNDQLLRDHVNELNMLYQQRKNSI